MNPTSHSQVSIKFWNERGEDTELGITCNHFTKLHDFNFDSVSMTPPSQPDS